MAEKTSPQVYQTVLSSHPDAKLKHTGHTTSATYADIVQGKLQIANGVSPPLNPATSTPIEETKHKRSYLQAAVGENEFGQPPPPDFAISDQDSTPIEVLPDQLKAPGSFLGKPALFLNLTEKAHLVSKLNYVLVGKFSHGRPTWHSVQSFFAGLKLQGHYNISIFDHKHMYIECSNKCDFDRIWLRLSWSIDGYIMRVFKWSPDFSSLVETPIAPVWIRMDGLPLYMFDEMTILNLANTIGSPIKIDVRNSTRSMLNLARVCVEIDVTKPIIGSIMVVFVDEHSGEVVEEHLVKVYYDCVPPYCSSCSHIGHLQTQCKRSKAGSKGEEPRHHIGKEQVAKLNVQTVEQVLTSVGRGYNKALKEKGSMEVWKPVIREKHGANIGVMDNRHNEAFGMSNSGATWSNLVQAGNQTAQIGTHAEDPLKVTNMFDGLSIKDQGLQSAELTDMREKEGSQSTHQVTVREQPAVSPAAARSSGQNSAAGVIQGAAARPAGSGAIQGAASCAEEQQPLTNNSGLLGDKNAQPVAHYTEQNVQTPPALTSTNDEQKESRSAPELAPKSPKEDEWQVVVSKNKRGSREKASATASAPKSISSRLVFDHNIQDVRSPHPEPRQIQLLRPSWADQVEEECEPPTTQQTGPNTTEEPEESDPDWRAFIKAHFLESSASIEAALRRRQSRSQHVTTEDSTLGKGIEPVEKGHESANKETKEEFHTTRGDVKPRHVHFHELVTMHMFEKEADRRSERLTPKNTSQTEKDFKVRVLDDQHHEGWPLTVSQGKHAHTPGTKAKSNDPG